jgi:hypothetical protein
MIGEIASGVEFVQNKSTRDVDQGTYKQSGVMVTLHAVTLSPS